VSPDTEAEAMSETTVLLVDDEEEFVSALGDRALAKVGKKKFDAILLDMSMPGMSGIETLKALLEINPDLQVILLTGRATLGQGVEAMKLGALDLLEKPADIETLVTKITEAAEKKETLQNKRTEDQVSEILRKKGW
jgi:DNA-binding NtrC family response regulator